ncbi:MAG: ATP-binding protein [Frankiaceae bacterium]|nr:ATP-binding protein [Frankiaceae bacterium]MBV9872183.1 ATP-binding protein [Frankiaceae bacterium]
MPAEYSAWQMSDGEKAALYLAGRALSSDPQAVLLVDEPETHFHSLLAIEFWNAIEAARPDLRIIYSTHDMMFATSRRGAQYLLANPKDGLTPVDLDNDGQVAALLLDTASLSFYSKRIVFCEGDETSLDKRLYSAWFDTQTTVVRPVGSCESVLHCVSALKRSNLISNLEVIGIIDRDYHSDERLGALSNGAVAVGVHEVETMFALPGVVGAVAKHLGQAFDVAAYRAVIVNAYKDADRHRVTLERWKCRAEALVVGVVASVSTKPESLDSLVAALPTILNPHTWDFDLRQQLQDEKLRVETAFSSNPPDLDEILQLMPGKQLLGVVSGHLGVVAGKYTDIVIKAVSADDPSLADLSIAIRSALTPYLPPAN